MRYGPTVPNKKYNRGVLGMRFANAKQRVANVRQRGRKYVYNIATRKVGRGIIVKLLNHYKINSSDKERLLKSYNTYLNAMNNKNNTNARKKAENAAANFTNTMFRLYEKTTIPNTPLSLGTKNGVIKKVAYWAPGVIGREGLRLIGIKI